MDEVILQLDEEERALYVQSEIARIEERHLQHMIDSNQQDTERAEWYAQKATQYLADYELEHEDYCIRAAEQYAELAKLVKEYRYTIGDIRKQRERVQWAKKRLAVLTKTAEQRQSSGHSKN